MVRQTTNVKTKGEIGAIIKARRLALGLTPNGLIERLNAMTGRRHSIYQIKNLEQGINGYTIDLLLKVAKILRLKLDLTPIND